MSMARTFDAETRTRGVIGHAKSLLGYPTKIWQNRYMVQNFFRRDLMGRFHGSMLGAWWMLIQPLFMFGVYYLVFGTLFNRGAGATMEYALYLFSGVVLFHALVEATSTSCGIVVANGNLVKKVAFPSEALPIHVGLVSMVLYFVGALVSIAASLISGTWLPGIELLALPLVMIVQFVMVVGMGLLLGNANVFVRDVSQLWRIFGMAWMFLTPVFWVPSMLYKALGEDSIIPSIMMNANPAYSLVMAQRIALFGEIPPVFDAQGTLVVDYGMVGLWGHLGQAAIWAVGFLIVGYTSFVANKHKHADIV
ncbi:MAG: ABC-type polysaccharide/polyol phosphate export permease [Planctomycetota bacterium]|jgi:ABC-type polysaccharide/polyol phosphate export permease